MASNSELNANEPLDGEINSNTAGGNESSGEFIESTKLCNFFLIF